MVAFRLLHIDVGCQIGVEEGGDDVYLFYLKVVVAGESEANTKGSVADCRGKD